MTDLIFGIVTLGLIALLVFDIWRFEPEVVPDKSMPAIKQAEADFDERLKRIIKEG